MPQYAVVRDGVVDVIVANSIEVAQEVTGLTAYETDGVPWVGWTRVGDAWVPPQPFPSWSWDKTNSRWTAPVDPPSTGPHRWSEDDRKWLAVPAPFKSWVWNEETAHWEPPIPMPSNSDQRVYWNEDVQDWLPIPNAEPLTE